MGPSRIRVFIADDHPMYRHGLVDTIKRRPELELLGVVSDGREALEQIGQLAPEVALLDVKMPGLGGLDVLRAVSRDELPTRVLFVSAYFESEVVYEALAAGAAGFLSKDSSGGEICDSIAAVARGDGARYRCASRRGTRDQAPCAE